MFGLNDMLRSGLLGGLAPLVVAAGAFVLFWKLTRRSGAAWSAGIILGYAAGAVAIETPDIGLLAALKKLVRPGAAIDKAPLAALVAALPAMLAAALGARRRWRWLLSAPIALAVPLWLFWGGGYLPDADARATGFTPDAWSAGRAAAILAGLVAAVLAAWWMWEAADPADWPRLRAGLTVLALTAAAMTAGLTGAFTFAQALGALAAAVGGSAAAGWRLGVRAGPEAAAGPTLLLAATVLVAAAAYSKLPAWEAAGLWAAVTVAAGWLSGLRRLPRWAQATVRTTLCVAPLAVVLWQAEAAFAETQRLQQEAGELNPYLNL